MLGTWRWYEPANCTKILVDRHCHSKVMQRFEPNVDPESSELLAALERALCRMKKPYIVAVDDDVSVLRAVERDLKTKFSSNYRILAIDSPQKAIGVVRQLTSRADRVALFLVDQRMPHMNGTEFLQEVIALQPEARRVLLTAYADSTAAIDAINKVKLNHYLMKPWEPPEQNLYPVLD